jgi:Secretion system C-terminal sorting domain
MMVLILFIIAFFLSSVLQAQEMRVIAKNGQVRTFEVANIQRIDYQEAGFMRVLLLSGTIERFSLSNVSSIQYQTPTSVQPVESKFSEINIFPNPVSGMFSADLKNFEKPYQLEVYQISGQMMFSKSDNTDDEWRINIPLDWKNGTYIFRVFNSFQESGRLFIIHR